MAILPVMKNTAKKNASMTTAYSRAQAGAEVVTAARKYLEYLKHQGLKIETAYLFGSYAKAETHAWSDLDVCVISSKFTRRFDAMSYLWRIRRREDIRAGIEPVGFHPKQFNEDSALASEILRHGIKIF